MNPSFSDKAVRKCKTVNVRFFLILTIFAVSVPAFLLAGNYAYAQQANVSDQTTLSEDLKNDPVAQDILKKIEQTKKMIEELQQKQFEQNQAQENLERVRDLSVEQLNQDLKEWERIWESHSSRNAFDSFVSKKPEYVQGVFWDQFEFKEQKVNAARDAMNKVLANGGTMQAAKDAYNRAAATQRIELIEVNAQFNVKHKLADYEEQQIFNSTGQVHFSPLTKSKMSEFYSDYKLQPNYILANPDDTSIVSAQRSSGTVNSGSDSVDTKCEEGHVLVSRITSENKTCVDENTAKNWIDKNVPGIIVYNSGYLGEISSDVKTNPATDCGEGSKVIYHMVQSEYQCVSDTTAKQMIDDNIAEIHTLVGYIHNKDKQKIAADKIYEINQKIKKINEEYDANKNALESEYQAMLEDEEALIKQQIRENIKKYKDSPNFTREDLSDSISELNDEKDAIQERILAERDTTLAKLESELRDRIAEAVKGHEGNPDIDVNWDYLGGVSNGVEESKPEPETVATSTTTATPQEDKTSNNDLLGDKIRIDNVDIVNSFGQKLDNVAIGQALQVVADVTNPSESKQNFVYMLDIKDGEDNPIQPTQWMTGTLIADQTFNVGLSWIPEDAGKYTATISTGFDLNSVLHVEEIEINVS